MELFATAKEIPVRIGDNLLGLIGNDDRPQLLPIISTFLARNLLDHPVLCLNQSEALSMNYCILFTYC